VVPRSHQREAPRRARSGHYRFGVSLVWPYRPFELLHGKLLRRWVNVMPALELELFNA
jgi:hypothetical protein